jgi:hypothetical protein
MIFWKESPELKNYLAKLFNLDLRQLAELQALA